MATTNPYAVGPERKFVNDALLSPLNFLKCAAFLYTNRITVISGSKHYTRKVSDNRCRPAATAAVFDCHFGMPSIFHSETKHQENQRYHLTSKNESAVRDSSF